MVIALARRGTLKIDAASCRRLDPCVGPASLEVGILIRNAWSEIVNESSIIWFETLFIAPETTSAREARDFVCTHLTRHDLLYLVDDIRLVVSELVTNAVVHAQPPVILYIHEQRGNLLVTVSDKSPELPVVPPHRLTDSGGRGLAIVGQVSREWG